MTKVPMIKPVDSVINPVRWITPEEYEEYRDYGYVYAVDFYRQREAKYATLRRELEKQMVINNVQG